MKKILVVLAVIGIVFIVFYYLGRKSVFTESTYTPTEDNPSRQDWPIEEEKDKG